LSQKRHKPFSSKVDTSLNAKPLSRMCKPKKGHNYKKNKELLDLLKSCKIITETIVWRYNPFPSVVMEIPVYTQKPNQEFLSRKSGIIMQKSNQSYGTCANHIR
jgi:hypothetical protein